MPCKGHHRARGYTRFVYDLWTSNVVPMDPNIVPPDGIYESTCIVTYGLYCMLMDQKGIDKEARLIADAGADFAQEDVS